LKVMPRDTLASVFDLLRASRLLRPDELRKLDGLWRHFQDPSELLRAVLKRGWLTAYQARELFAGQGEGLLVGQYVVLEQLGQGATARVFKVRHRETGTVVALKVLRGPTLDALAVDRLHRERWAGVRLKTHPNILQTHGTGQAEQTRFLVMEYAEGRSLGRLVQEQGPLPVGRACDYVRQASLGLAHALERGLVHRDMKPGNLLLTPSGVVKILDLGIAGLAGTQVAPAVGAAGTPDYVAPEQVAEPARADPRSDVYGLGCTLYHLLTGRPPFPGGTLQEKLCRHREEEPAAVDRLRPELPARLGGLVGAMLAKRPPERPLTAAVAGALEPFAEAGGCEARYVLELDEGGLVDLDPGQDTSVLARAGPFPDR
jgi:serine/threonine-protein kinase